MVVKKENKIINHVRIHVTENTAPSKPVKGHTVLPIEAPNHQSHPWKHKQPGNDRMQPVDGCAQVIHRIACMDRSMASLFFSLRSPPPCKQAGKSSMELMAARPAASGTACAPVHAAGHDLPLPLSLLVSSWAGRRPGNLLLRLQQQQQLLLTFFLLEPDADTATSGSICQCSS